ncbi:uncharacterized protein LOC128555806 [Mercenaria mercenaria]|uniref:uncharacterized protein LOC128555806 n=1 Tax=Mercenaria mercenaria TaxID=6596 RepID=UPI00234E3860|nr:uncharacterized protein LOC128555806 [Mercenaria mercenaria]
METDDQYLKRIYSDPNHPGSFSGPGKLKQVIDHEGKRDISLGKIKHFLQGQDTYTLNRPIKHKFTRNAVITRGIRDMWDGDLADMTRLAKWNSGVKFLLVVIDVFSRFAIVKPLHDKKADTVLTAFRNIVSENGKPRVFRSDFGAEFKNTQMASFLAKNNIKHVFANPPIKAGYAERLILSLKQLIFRYLHFNNTFVYVDKLDTLVRNYNYRVHRSLGVSPSEINKSNESRHWNEMYINRPYKQKIYSAKPNEEKLKILPARKFRFKINQFVRVSINRRTFERSFDQKFSDEIFKIKDREMRSNIPVYYLQDLQNDPIIGAFHTSELQPVSKSEDSLFKVEKILKRRGKGDNREVLVRWRGYPPKFDSYIPLSSLTDV